MTRWFFGAAPALGLLFGGANLGSAGEGKEGGKPSFSEETGYGVVDALAAVQRAGL